MRRLARLRPVALWWLLGGLLLAAIALNLCVGSVWIPLGDVLNILLGGEPERETWKTIVLTFRLPRVLTAILGGTALSASGLQMQTLFGNPLAGPFVLGISSGASLGVAIAVLNGQVSSWGRILAACGGAAAVLGLAIVTAQQIRSRETLLLLGLIFGYATSAAVTILLHFSALERVQSYLLWTFGSFGGVTWERLGILAGAVVVGLAIALFVGKSLNLLMLGETSARSLGLGVRWLQFWTICSAAVLAGAVTAFCGPIAFVGVAVPHLSRALLRTSDFRILLPGSMLVGATLALMSDWLAQLPGSSAVLPLNAVTAILGTPVVVQAVLQRHRRS